MDIEEVLSGAVGSDMHLFVADAFQSYDTVDRGILDRVLRGLGLLAWFQHAYFECHVHVRVRFKLAAGLGVPWTRDGGHTSGMPVEYDAHYGSVFAMVKVFLPLRMGLNNSCMLIMLSVQLPVSVSCQALLRV